jgi:hypothetical protein
MDHVFPESKFPLILCIFLSVPEKFLRTILDYVFKLSINWLVCLCHFKYFHLEIGCGGDRVSVIHLEIGGIGGGLEFHP